MEIIQIIDWIDEIYNSESRNCTKYYLEDIYNYMSIGDLKELKDNSQIENILRTLCIHKYESLRKCESKTEVEEWLDKIIGFIILKFDVELIIQDYFR